MRKKWKQTRKNITISQLAEDNQKVIATLI